MHWAAHLSVRQPGRLDESTGALRVGDAERVEAAAVELQKESLIAEESESPCREQGIFSGEIGFLAGGLALTPQEGSRRGKRGTGQTRPGHRSRGPCGPSGKREDRLNKQRAKVHRPRLAVASWQLHW